MTQQVDLNEVRNRVINNRQQGVDLPRSPRQAVYVDNGGNIVTDPEPSGHRHLSQVPQKIFAASLMQDRQVVVRKLPPNAQEMNISGVTGWVYDITSELGDHYTMFIFNDGSLYQVMVLFPEVAGRYSVTEGHLFPNGCICLNEEHGYRSLEQAYAKSVLWATGFSIYARTGNFPL
ncbi:hypothetical protein [Limnospira fusiformis]|uniref:hypothetical protein n=1 Tax=Limnospira fusiformis TaxID=54297 RepID=UPI0034E085DD